MKNWRKPLFLALAAVAVPYFLMTGVPAGFDTQYEGVRLVEFREAMPDQILPRWAPDVYHGYGSPLFIFYPWLFSLIANLFWWILGNPDAALKLAILLCRGAAVGFCYAWLRRHFSSNAALAGAFAYAFSFNGYILLYTRFACAEHAAMSLLPAVFYFASRTVGDGSRRSHIGLFLTCLLLGLTHNPTLLLAPPFVLAYILVESKGLRRAGGTLATVALGIASAAFFLLPVVTLAHRIRLADLQFILREWASTGTNCMAARDLFLNPSFLYYLSPVPALLMIGGGTLWLRRPGRMPGVARYAVAVSAIIVVLVNPALDVVWKTLPLRLVQFPWRLFTVHTLLLAPLAACLFDFAAAGRRRAEAMAVLAGLTLCALAVWHFRPVHIASIQSLSPERIAVFGYSATYRHEYLPLTATEVPAELSDKWRYRVHGGFAMDRTGPGQIVFPLTSFPVWQAEVDGRPVPIDPNAACVTVVVPPGPHHVTVRLGWTPEHWAGIGLSGLAMILFGICLWRLKRSPVTIASGGAPDVELARVGGIRIPGNPPGEE